MTVVFCQWLDIVRTSLLPTPCTPFYLVPQVKSVRSHFGSQLHSEASALLVARKFYTSRSVAGYCLVQKYCHARSLHKFILRCLSGKCWTHTDVILFFVLWVTAGGINRINCSVAFQLLDHHDYSNTFTNFSEAFLSLINGTYEDLPFYYYLKY